jgi:hypothetical protein
MQSKGHEATNVMTTHRIVVCNLNTPVFRCWQRRTTMLSQGHRSLPLFTFGDNRRLDEQMLAAHLEADVP